MPQEIILRIGDTIKYFNARCAVIEKIRIIYTGEMVEQYRYDGEGHDIILTLKDNIGIINLWVKDIPIHKVIDKQGKG